MCVCVCVCVYVRKRTRVCVNFQYLNPKNFSLELIVIWPTVGGGDAKAPFSIATTPRCKEGATTFPGLLLLSMIHTF